MNIETMVRIECPKRNNPEEDGGHDKAYEKALREAYDKFHDLPIDLIKTNLEYYREQFSITGSTHENTASCMVLYELTKKE
jgi:hypothetical protein